MGAGASCSKNRSEDVYDSDSCVVDTREFEAALGISGLAPMSSAKRALERSSPMTHYNILRRIGRGSYGTVYLVRDLRDALYYCAKQIILETGSDDEKRAAELEVATLRQLDHPSIVSYHDHFVHLDGSEQSLCLVMAYCEGGDLSRAIKLHAGRTPKAYFSEDQVIAWLVEMTAALHYVHSKGILHRDLKSQNVFLSNNHAKLGDFGIVKVLDGSVTSAQTVIGT